MNIAKILMLGAQISIFLTVLSLGMRASLAEILYLFRRPGQLIRALLSVYVVMPVVAILMVTIFTLNPVVEVVLIALSISPVPPLFPGKAFKSGGDTSFTFGLLAAITLLSVIVIPIAFGIFDVVLKRETQFTELSLVFTVMKTLILPMVIGMMLRYFAPAFCARFGDVIGKIAGILLIVSILPILIFILPLIWSLIGDKTVLAFIIFALAGGLSGYFLGGPDPHERTVLALATTSRHPAIAITLAAANVDDTPTKLVAAAVILYLIVSTIVIAPFLKWLSDHKGGEKKL
jgi:BASS family bile acid:Na+ symporter